MNKKLLPVSVAVMSLLVLFMLAGVLPAPGGGQAVVFRTPVFITLMGMAGLLLAYAVFGWKLKANRLGFTLSHAGLVLVLGGAFAGFVASERVDVTVPISPTHALRQLRGPDGTAIPLGFALGVTNFTVRFYDPDYHLYAPEPAGPDGRVTDYRHVASARMHRDRRFDFGDFGRIEAAALNPTGGDDLWAFQHRMPGPGDLMLQRGALTPRWFAAALRLEDPDGAVRVEDLAVNHPVSHRGWRFYLMSYDQQARRHVVLHARRDPGRPAVVAGLWMVMLGTFVTGLRRTPRGGTDVES